MEDNANLEAFLDFKKHLESALHTSDPEHADFKHQLWLLLQAMDRRMRRSHPHVGKPGTQFNESKVLAELLPENPGYYVDVGAAEPVECSNTWEFYQRGWRGLLIECLPSAWNALLRHRPGDFLYPVAASDRAGFAQLRVAHTVSSIQPDWDIQEMGSMVVETATLSSILDKFPVVRDNCGLLSIDVEGSEGLVLKGIDWERFKPKVIIIEAYRYRGDETTVEDMSADWECFLADYKLHTRNQLNKIYVRK